MEELRIDVSKLTKEEQARWKKEVQNVWKLNHTMPYTDEYNELLDKLIPNRGENVDIRTPLAGVNLGKVVIGNNVVIMNGSLMMASGGITIEDNTMLAANVQLISNNHDLDVRAVITCLPIHIKKNCWIGAGATILRGVTIGENAVVGAGSVVTKDVPDNVIVAGNPAKIIKRIHYKRQPPKKLEHGQNVPQFCRWSKFKRNRN